MATQTRKRQAPKRRALSAQAQVEQDAAAKTQREARRGGRGKLNQSSMLLKLFSKSFTLIRDEMNGAYAVPMTGPNIAQPLDATINRLTEMFHLENGKAPTANAVAEAKRILRARVDRANHRLLPLRVGWYPRKRHTVLIDMGNAKGEAIAVSPEGWEVLDRSPEPFRRTEATKPLFDPRKARRSTPDAMRGLFNVSDKAWDFLVAWLVTCWVPDIPHIMPVLEGKAGRAKTSLATCLMDLVDPSLGALSGNPSKRDELEAHARGSWVLGLENMSHITPETSDQLSQLITGAARRTRKLYTNADVHISEFRRVVVMNGIHITGMRSDLVDRSVTINLLPIAKAKRLTKEVCDRRYDKGGPDMVRYLLDVLVGALGVKRDGQQELAERYRMADAEQWLRYVDVVRGTETLESYRQVYEQDAMNAAQDHPLTSTIELRLLKERSMKLPARSWLAQVGEPTNGQARDWPKTPKAFTQEMMLIEDGLVALGWTVKRTSPHGTIWWEIGLPKDSETR